MRQETRILGAFHGFVLDDGHTFTNWGLSRSTEPAVYLEPVSYANVTSGANDFIVCRSGSSCSVVARRLAEHPNVTALLLEAGGDDDVPAVMDAGRRTLKVYGVERLRIADGSIMPRVTTVNTMAPYVVIGERDADILRTEHRLSVDAEVNI
jgi:choline dehydrogenase-like flavoprotein